MLKIDVKSDISGALAKLGRISDTVKSKATVRALNKTADQAKVQAAREIRDAGYGLKVGRIKKGISIRKSSASSLTAVVNAVGRPIGLIDFGARQTKAGVTVAVKNGRKLIRGAFIAQTASGHVGVFMRKGAGHKKVMKGGKIIWSGLPVDQLFGPGVPSAFMNKIVQDALKASVSENFPKVFAQELKYWSLK